MRLLLFGWRHVDGLSEMDASQHGVVRVGKVELEFQDAVDLAHRERVPSVRRMLAVENQIAGHVARHSGLIELASELLTYATAASTSAPAFRLPMAFASTFSMAWRIASRTAMMRRAVSGFPQL